MERITVYHGVNWIADSMENPPKENSKELAFRFGKGSDKLSIAELMRSTVPMLTKQILECKSDEILTEFGGKFLAATPPRPYLQVRYDCAQSDIVVIGPAEEKESILNRFQEEKARAIQLKSNLGKLMELFKPVLEELVSLKLAEGVIGRGSYFDKNGYPKERDDVDFILLKRKISDEYEYELKEALRTTKHDVTIANERFGMEIIKKGPQGSPVFSYIVVTEKDVRGARGIKYEKYVLENGVGISLKNLAKGESEKLAAEFISLLPDHDTRIASPL
jgi:hypothetical protein